MSSSFYEIVELSPGEIVLKRSDDDKHAPLVTLKFSEESIAFLGANRFEVAKAMIEAGMDAASELAAEAQEEIAVDTAAIEAYILH